MRNATTELGTTVDQRQVQLLEADAAAWDAYGSACRRGAPDEIRRSLYERARATMNELAGFERERAHGSR